MWNESEEECAERWRAEYGIERGHLLAEIYAKSASRPMRAFYAKVSFILGQFIEPRRNQRHLARAGEAYRTAPAQVVVRPRARQPKTFTYLKKGDA